jgi:exopolysaccharide biosynthesis polyprenyl glycosylphosphotransferase
VSSPPEVGTGGAETVERVHAGRGKFRRLPRSERLATRTAAHSRPRSSVTIQRDALFRRLLCTADVVSIALALIAAATVADGGGLTLAAAALPLTFVVIVKATGLYDRDENLLHKNTLDEVPALFALATLCALLLSASGEFLLEGGLQGAEVAVVWGLLLVLLVSLRSVARSAARELSPSERCLFVGDAAGAEEFREKLGTSHAVKAELAGWIPVMSAAESHSNGDAGQSALADRIRSMIDEREIQRVVLGPGPARSEELLDAVRQMRGGGIKVSVLPLASRVVSPTVELDRLHGITLLGLPPIEITRSSRMVKRCFDVVGASLALALLSPFLLLVALAIKLDSPGPVFFRQRRIGRHGDRFEMFKFRSMVEGADERKVEIEHLNEGAPGLFKIAADPRCTGVGRFLRRWRIDELPQLINVVRGDMSLVGPRPLIPEEDQQITGWYRRRLDVPPGITGHWQVLGSSSRISLVEMVKLDYLYVANWSVWGDVQLLLRTIPFVLRGNGV